MESNSMFTMSNAQFQVGFIPEMSNSNLLIRADENGYYEIGIQLNPNEILRLASATQDEIIEKIEFWKDRVEAVKQEYQAV